MPKAKPATGVYICGKAVGDIRKSYFDGKIEDLLADIMASQSMTPEDVAALGAELEKLKKEEKETIAALKEKVTGPLLKEDESKPPSLDDLLLKATLSPEEEEQIKKWREECIWAVNKAKDIIRHYGKDALLGKLLDKEKLISDAQAMNTLRVWLGQDMREKERLYKIRLIKIIDNFGVSRREADDRAQVTDEYIAFQNARDFFEIVMDFIINARRQYSGQFGG